MRALESLPPKRRFASAAERTRADSLCTHSRCYFRPTRPTAAWRVVVVVVVIDPPFSLFFTRVPSFGLSRGISPRMLALSATVLSRSRHRTQKGSIHSLTTHRDYHPRKTRRKSLSSLRMPPVSRMLSKVDGPIRQNRVRSIDRSIDRRRRLFGQHDAPYVLLTVSFSLSPSLGLETATSRH